MAPGCIVLTASEMCLLEFPSYSKWLVCKSRKQLDDVLDLKRRADGGEHVYDELRDAMACLLTVCDPTNPLDYQGNVVELAVI